LGSVRRRIERLEERRGRALDPGPAQLEEARRKRGWRGLAAGRRRDATHSRDEHQALDIFRLWRLQGRLPSSTEELLARIGEWRPRPPEKHAAARAIYRLVRDGEEGTEGMTCPPEWQESFEAAEDLAERYAAIPDEVLAAARVGDEEGADDVTERRNAVLAEYGITDELILKALGPDRDEISGEEVERRVLETVAETIYGEKGYRIKQEIRKLREETA
jgi:hypothetical protein